MYSYRNIQILVKTLDDNQQIEYRLYKRLTRIVDGIIELLPDCIETIKRLEDDKNNLNVYWLTNPSNLNKLIINGLWMDEREFHVNHILINPSHGNKLNLPSYI